MSKTVMIIDEQKFESLVRKIDKISVQLERLNAKNDLSLDQKWMVTSEVQQVLSISLRKLQQMRTNGEIKFSKHGKKIYYRASDVQAYLELL